jgi:hypothetical protein
MRRITKIITGLTLAAGVVASGGAAMAMGDGDHYRSSTSSYYSSPGTTYDEDRTPSTMYYTPPPTTYSETDIYNTPSGVYGYYDNPYNPYWNYRGPLGQGSGHDMRIGR